MRHRIFLTLLLLTLVVTGCGVPIVPVRFSEAQRYDPIGLQFLLQDAEDYVGVPLLRVDKPYGAISVTLIRTAHEEELGGQSFDNIDDVDCELTAWSEPDPRILAHEIIHALGHDWHVDPERYPDNLMTFDAAGDELTGEQHNIIWEGAQLLDACTIKY